MAFFPHKTIFKNNTDNNTNNKTDMSTDNDTDYDTNNDNDKTFLLSEKPKLYRLYT